MFHKVHRICKNSNKDVIQLIIVFFFIQETNLFFSLFPYSSACTSFSFSISSYSWHYTANVKLPSFQLSVLINISAVIYLELYCQSTFLHLRPHSINDLMRGYIAKAGLVISFYLFYDNIDWYFGILMRMVNDRKMRIFVKFYDFLFVELLDL